MGCKIAERNNGQKMHLETESEDQTKAINQPFKQAAYGRGILENDTYNLMEQLEIESKSLWRIKNNYKNEALTDNESKQLWNFIERDKEKVVRLLTEKIRERL